MHAAFPLQCLDDKETRTAIDELCQMANIHTEVKRNCECLCCIILTAFFLVHLLLYRYMYTNEGMFTLGFQSGFDPDPIQVWSGFHSDWSVHTECTLILIRIEYAHWVKPSPEVVSIWIGPVDSGWQVKTCAQDVGAMQNKNKEPDADVQEGRSLVYTMLSFPSAELYRSIMALWMSWWSYYFYSANK